MVDLIESQGFTIKEAAAYLKINYSTAKHIMKLYKKTGEVQSFLGLKRQLEKERSLLKDLIQE